MQNEKTHVLEVVVFTVKNDEVARVTDLREGLVQAVKTLPGWVSYAGYKPVDNSGVFVDLVTWDSHESALAAAQTVESDPRFMPYMSSIESVTFMGHLQSDVVSSN